MLLAVLTQFLYCVKFWWLLDWACECACSACSTNESSLVMLCRGSAYILEINSITVPSVSSAYKRGHAWLGRWIAVVKLLKHAWLFRANQILRLKVVVQGKKDTITNARDLSASYLGIRRHGSGKTTLQFSCWLASACLYINNADKNLQSGPASLENFLFYTDHSTLLLDRTDCKAGQLAALQMCKHM